MSQSRSKQTVLIVDDEPFNIQTLELVLGDEHNLTYATSGHMALEMAQAEPRPDLILMDIVMPDLDGFEVCKRLKENTRTHNIPIIFLTAKWETSEEAKGLELGAVDYIRKPFSPPIIRARIRNHLELKKNRDLLENLSTLDGLTNIPNRRRFDEVFTLEWRRAVRSGLPISLLFIDIDHFKNYNDHYGHLAGDDCLKAVSRVLQSSLGRTADFVARFGGEEFIILLPDTGENGCRHLAETIRAAVENLNIEHQASPLTPHLTVSVGAVTCVAVDTITQEDLLDAADRLLYQAKQDGRNRVSFQLMR
ncbi:MAG: diguanylate cyclase [Deltaproteobacteria bacterium]|nr:diguanylate cyclase [Deltaproteobacteria bacterium]